MIISAEYATLNRAMHARGNYGVSGHRWAPMVHDLARQCEAATVLDYGCGTGTLRQALERAHGLTLPYRVLEYDPAIPGKEDKPRRADIVVCGDVLEHVEPAFLRDVLDDIAETAERAVFLVIATTPANKHLPDGRNAHLIVEHAEWWLPQIIARWRLRQFQDFGSGFFCIGAAL